MISTNGLMVEQCKIVQGLAPITPSSSVPDYVSLKNYQRMTVLIEIDNGATVTGTAITLKQAQAVANTGEKALAFDKMWANLNTAATDTLVETAVTSNTFTSLTTDNLNLMYVIEVDPATLDVANGFDCVRVGTANGVNCVTSVVYILWPAKYGKATPPSAILD
jgi:hypothetical protein